MRSFAQIALFAFGVTILVLTLRSPRLETPHPALEALDMRASTSRDEKALSEKELEFLEAYLSTNPAKRAQAVLDWSNEIGLEATLNALDRGLPYCHGEAHALGKLAFQESLDFGQALSLCGNSCTEGCFHGVLIGALEYVGKGGKSEPHASLEEVKDSATLLCNDNRTLALHREGNCSHGIGHAFTTLAENDLDRALKACETFSLRGLRYYCFTGAFMEHLLAKRQELRGKPVDVICKSYPEFPAACYRYEVGRLKAEGASLEKLRSECLSRNGLERLACFHGLGHAYTKEIYESPSLLGSICASSDLALTTICSDAPIELIAQVDEPLAIRACASLPEEAQAPCAEAAKRKIYSLKENFYLYYPVQL